MFHSKNESIRQSATFLFPIKQFLILKLPYLFLILFSLVLLSSIFLPIYSDEAVTKWAIARFFEESGKALFFYPQCSKTMGIETSWLFYPATLLYSLIYKNLFPLGLRISGLVVSFLWLSGVSYWCFKNIRPGLAAAYFLAALLAASLALGVMPYIFIMARPEQMLMLIILLSFLYCLFWRNNLSTAWQCLAGLIFILLCSCFFYIHPKTLFFLPFMMAAAWLITEKAPRLLQLAVILVPVIFAYKTFQVANLTANCPETPLLNNMLAMNTLYPSLLWNSPFEFFQQGFSNIQETPGKIIAHLLFQPTYQSFWLPGGSAPGKAVQALNSGIDSLLYILIVGSHLLVISFFVYYLVKRSLAPSILLGGFLALGSLANSFFYKLWTFYGADQFLPLSILLILSLTPFSSQKRFSSRLYSVSILLMLFASISMAVLVTNYLPTLLSNAKTTKADITGQFLSIPVFGVDNHMKTIKALAKKCKLPSENIRNLVVDHMTYYAFKDTQNPIHVLYISEIGFGKDLADGKLEPFLRQIASPGIISQCAYIPPQLEKLPRIESNDYCCINLQQ